MSDLSHTISVRPNPFLRFFLWFWDIRGDLNTCLIFWGVLGIIAFWPLRLFFGLLSLTARGLVRVLPERNASTEPTLDVPPEPRKPSRGSRFLTAFSHRMSAIWFKFEMPITWTFRIILGLIGLGLVGLAIYGLTTVTWSWTILWDALIWLGAVTVSFALVAVLAICGERRQRRPKKHTIRRIYRSVHDHTCANVIIEK